jgi:hypothetical protein
MTNCWKVEPSERPTFEDLHQFLHDMLMVMRYCLFIIYRPRARGIRRNISLSDDIFLWANISRSDDIFRGALPRGKYHH